MLTYPQMSTYSFPCTYPHTTQTHTITQLCTHKTCYTHTYHRHIHMCACTNIHLTYVYTHIHTHTYTHKYIHLTHTYVLTCTTCNLVNTCPNIMAGPCTPGINFTKIDNIKVTLNVKDASILTHTRTHARTHALTNTHTHTHNTHTTHTYTHTSYTYTYKHTHINTHTSTHKYKHTLEAMKMLQGRPVLQRNPIPQCVSVDWRIHEQQLQ